MLICWKFICNNFAFVFSYSWHLKENIPPNYFHLWHLSLISFSNHFFFFLLMLKKLFFIFWINNHSWKFAKVNNTLILRHGVLDLKLKMIKRVQVLSKKQNSWTFILLCYKNLIIRYFIVLVIDVNNCKLQVDLLSFRL